MALLRHKSVVKAVPQGLVFCALGLIGCHAAPSARFATAESALAQLQSQTECSRGVVGEAKLVLSKGPFKVSGDVMYMASAPDRLRFDLYSDFGVTLSTLTSDGKSFTLYSLEEKSFWYGPAKTCNLERFTRVPVPPSALVELLRGRAPLLAHGAEDIRIRLMRPWFSAPYYRVDIAGDHQSTQRLKLGFLGEDIQKSLKEQRLKLLSVEVRQGGKLSYRVKLDAHRITSRASLKPTQDEIEMGIGERTPSGPECEAIVPGTLTFIVPGSGYQLAIINEEISHNPALLPSAFTQVPPDGVRAEFSDCEP